MKEKQSHTLLSIDHRLHALHILLHSCDLHRCWCILLSIIWNQIRWNLFHVRRLKRERKKNINKSKTKSYLILQEQSHEVLCELNLLCERVIVEVEELLELWLHLNHHDSKQCRLQLHRSICLCKALLFRWQRCNRILKLLRCWNRLDVQWNLQVVLVLHNDGILGEEQICWCNRSKKNDEWRELTSSCN